MKSKYRNIIADLSLRLKERFPGNIVDVILFGSRASGKDHKDSDYDILIILNRRQIG